MACLTASKIVEAKDIKRQEVEVPEWGGSVYIKELSNIEADEFEKWQTSRLAFKGLGANRTINPKQTDLRGQFSKFLSMCMVDDDNQLLFSDYKALTKKSYKVIKRLYDLAVSYNGMDDESQEESEKNSESGQND